MLKFGLVGCGRIADRHATLLSGDAIPGASLAAVCDIDAEKARKYGERFEVPFYESYHDMLKSEDLDVVSILTPSGMHAENVVELAEYGKHLVVEKPMALKLSDADRMIRSCSENKIKLFVVKQNRFNLPVQKLREALEGDRFGQLVLGTVRVRWCRKQDYYDRDSWRGTWKFDGGVLTNQASHHIDLLEWMMGEVESVFARSTNALVDIEAEDTAVVTVKFKNGALGIIEATTAARPTDLEGSISILGSQGTVEIAGFAVNEIRHWKFEDEQASDSDVMAKYSTNPPNVYGFGHREYYNHVVDCIQNDARQLVDGLEGRRSLELISSIYESIETGQEVRLRFQPQKCKLGM